MRHYQVEAYLVAGRPRVAAIRTSAAQDSARLLCLTCPRGSVMVMSLVLKSAAICWLSIPETTSGITSHSRGGQRVIALS
jgi:hypothetical protein